MPVSGVITSYSIHYTKLYESPGHAPIRVYLGAQTGDDVRQLGLEFEHLGCRVRIATDDGSLGVHGLVTVAFEEQLSRVQKAYVCGPMPMMAATARLCAMASIPCEVSLESHMRNNFV